MVDCCEELGEESVGAFGGALGCKVMGQVGAPKFGGDTFHEVLPSNGILGMKESEKIRGPGRVITKWEALAPRREA
jgi:hypothetical protein